MGAGGFDVYFWGGLPSKAYEGGMFASCAAMGASGFVVYFLGGLPRKAYERGMFVLPVQQWARVVLLSTVWGGSHSKLMKEACLRLS